MAGPYNYINSLGTKVTTTIKINMCRRGGPMSFCMACETEDQHGCLFREPASSSDHCLYWRENMDGACDGVWAQTSKENPNKIKE